MPSRAKEKSPTTTKKDKNKEKKEQNKTKRRKQPAGEIRPLQTRCNNNGNNNSNINTTNRLTVDFNDNNNNTINRLTVDFNQANAIILRARSKDKNKFRGETGIGTHLYPLSPPFPSDKNSSSLARILTLCQKPQVKPERNHTQHGSIYRKTAPLSS